MTLDEQLTVDLWLLDAVLTGKDPRYGRGGEDNYVTCEKFHGRQLFYLSDGGYSRVFYEEIGARVGIATESREEVKTEWDSPQATTIRRRIERRISEWMADQS